MAEARRYSKGSRCLASAGKREVASLRRAQGPSFVAVEAARCWVRQDSSVDKVHEGVMGVDADADAADAVGDVVVAEVEVEVEVAAVVAVVVGVDAGSGEDVKAEMLSTVSAAARVRVTRHGAVVRAAGVD